jgi:sugar phosphate isomerase/epimerase
MSEAAPAGIGPRPVTLFTGQWADLPFEQVARPAGEWGDDGLEIACWGDHLDPVRSAHDDDYVQDRLRILAENNLIVHAIAIHLTGQAVCDGVIDERHQGILAIEVRGDGDPEGRDFVTAGHGDVPWNPIFRMFNSIGYEGPTSIEWEDAGMDRLIGAPRALALVRELARPAPSAAAVDAAFPVRNASIPDVSEHASTKEGS